jgi:hypothetical protein
MTNNAYAKNNGDGLLCSILCPWFTKFEFNNFFSFFYIISTQRSYIYKKTDTNRCFAKLRAISNLFSFFLYTLYMFFQCKSCLIHCYLLRSYASGRKENGKRSRSYWRNSNTKCRRRCGQVISLYFSCSCSPINPNLSYYSHRPFTIFCHTNVYSLTVVGFLLVQ